jgi:hypothetical protein
VYFLARWVDSGGATWLEALVKVNLKLPKPKPELVGKFDGFTVAKAAVDDQLLLLGSSPAAFVSRPDRGWGVGTFDRAKKAFAFQPLGLDLMDAIALSPRLALAMEKTDYGKVRVSRFDLVTGARRDVAELDGKPTFVDSSVPPLARVPTNLGEALRNLETGVQLMLPQNAIVRRTPAGLIIWPSRKPQLAALFAPERFLKLASVKAAPPAETEQGSPTAHKPPPED